MYEHVLLLAEKLWISYGTLIATITFFILGSRIVKTFAKNHYDNAFLILNLSCIWFWFRKDIESQYKYTFFAIFCWICLFYIFKYCKRKSYKVTSLHLMPVLYLFLIKYVPAYWFAKPLSITGIFSISYITLRMSLFFLEVQNNKISKFSLSSFLSYILFFPTLFVGPISPMSIYKNDPSLTKQDVWENVVRIFLGLGKYYVIAVVFSRLNFTNYWSEQYMHNYRDILVSSISYYLYLYFNFSGFCDIMIATSRLAGFEILENFNSPLKARNVKDFWNRWHITLSSYVKDVMFTPLSTFLISRFGLKYLDIFIALTSLIVFMVVGAWHGVGLNFLLFGVFHGLGLVLVHFYTVFLKKHFPRNFKNYMKSNIIYLCSWFVSFIYISLSFFFFENNIDDISRLLKLIKY